MSRRAIVLLAASVIAGVGSTAAVAADALAKKAVRHPVAVAVVPPPPVPVVLIDNNYGPVATRIPRCFDSPILYPYPPCY
jgi:dihydrodipicolinate synthase/N-acetylneuraminate lyase